MAAAIRSFQAGGRKKQPRHFLKIKRVGKEQKG